MEESAFLRERVTAATAHKDTLGRTVRLVSDAYTHSHIPHKHTHSGIMKPALHQAVHIDVRLSNGLQAGQRPGCLHTERGGSMEAGVKGWGQTVSAG